ncbi:hypothetical protein MPH_02737 [Macrophomina phaseolina MS6]|uniref:Uncharacterized protein n=1 Tax=Macrophomina phaseolina (strain MS6) TaxID=1126212 RepID=K2SBY8_MACPH|nr:hypothetical protein MPH_02737 [Macrophomina phaseolina MS6]
MLYPKAEPRDLCLAPPSYSGLRCEARCAASLLKSSAAQHGHAPIQKGNSLKSGKYASPSLNPTTGHFSQTYHHGRYRKPTPDLSGRVRSGCEALLRFSPRCTLLFSGQALQLDHLHHSNLQIPLGESEMGRTHEKEVYAQYPGSLGGRDDHGSCYPVYAT